jgi:hypothetical protein
MMKMEILLCVFCHNFLKTKFKKKTYVPKKEDKSASGLEAFRTRRI